MEANANIEATDVENWRSLHFATQGGHTDVAKKLIEAEATVDATQNKGLTALHLASFFVRVWQQRLCR